MSTQCPQTLVVEGPLVCPESGVKHGQVLIDGGVFTEVHGPRRKPDLFFDDNHLIFPGFVDVHVHLREGQEYKEDYLTGAAAAAQGGVTSCLDMPNNPISPVDAETMARKLSKLPDSPINIGMYAAIGPGTQGFDFPHYKLFMAHSTGPLFFESLKDIAPTLEHYRGSQVTYHCEDPEMLQALEGQGSHEEQRPPEAEAAAVKVAIELAERFDLKTNIAHLSSRQGLELLLEHPHITREVTPHHLFFDLENRSKFERGELLKMNPPLRDSQTREALMAAFKGGQIHFLATDHAPHTLEEKLGPNPPSGVPHLDTYGAFVAWLHLEHDISAAHLARHCCALPGAFMGPKLGRIEVGYRGDLAILNLKESWTVKAEDLKTKCAWSPFEGFTFPGRVVRTIAAGQVVF